MWEDYAFLGVDERWYVSKVFVRKLGFDVSRFSSAAEVLLVKPWRMGGRFSCEVSLGEQG